MAASTPYRRTGWRVISTTSSGFMQDSSMPDALAEREVLGQRAARLAHEPDRGVRDRLAAGGPRKALSEVGRSGHERSLAGQSACSHIGTAGPTYCEHMVVGQETHPATGAGAAPPEFRDAVATMHAARLRPEIFCEEMPAPAADRAVRLGALAPT